MPRESGAARWHFATFTDASYGGASTVRIQDSAQQSLRFDFKVSQALPYPMAFAALLVDDEDGKLASADMSKYSTASFRVKCSPANSLLFIVTVSDETATKPLGQLTYMPAMTFFSCNEKEMPVSLDLTHLTIPQWWHQAEHVDISRQSYKLDHVAKIEFGASQYSPRELDSHVEISELTLHGRDYRYIVALAAFLVIGWSGFGIWFIRAHSRALAASLDAHLKDDLPIVAYRQLTLEPFKDKEKAGILQFIATHYTNSELDMDTVATRIGADRERINEILKMELGLTFTGYVNKLRLTEAARLLTDKSSKPIAEIAYSVGYANASYFNKLFREEYGCTPKAFRSLATQPKPPSEHDTAEPSNPSLDEAGQA